MGKKVTRTTDNHGAELLLAGRRAELRKSVVSYSLSIINGSLKLVWKLLLVIHICYIQLEGL